ncbi:MAG: gfo/Idh/MocA family oxidoreductase, partial [Armatimonadetes bacterium]|nr:gfo/Idh/MocA family oxidoreductase [Armatimonadota bacterium]
LACHAAALAWKLGRKLRFDPVKEEFVGDDEANRMRSRARREPWSV